MNPLLLDFPDHFETERLLIHAPRAGDGAALNRAVCESLEALRPWMPWAQTAPTLEESECTVRHAISRWMVRSDLMLFVWDKNGEFVGGSGLHRPDWDVPRFEIGYWRRTGFGGRGLMTEAVRGIADFAFETLGAKRVEIRCSAANHRSAALAHRAGFEHEATLRSTTRWQEQLHDELIFARLPEPNP